MLVYNQQMSDTAFGFPGIMVEHWTTNSPVRVQVRGLEKLFYLHLRQMEQTLNQLWYFF